MNAQYKSQADQYHRHKEYTEGKLIMVHLNKQLLPTAGSSKLQSKKYALFLVLKKINSNSYVLGLPHDWQMLLFML